MRISDWSSDVCSSDLRGSRIVGGRVVPRCSKRRSLFNTGLDRHLGASRDGGSINLIIGTATARAHRGTCRVDFALQKLVVLPRLALTLDELTHQLPHHLRCGRSEEHTSELQSLMRISYAAFCLKKKK